MWIAIWILCTTVCQPIQEVDTKKFKTKEQCIEYAKDGAKELLQTPGATQVGYKCIQSDEKDA